MLRSSDCSKEGARWFKMEEEEAVDKGERRFVGHGLRLKRS